MMGEHHQCGFSALGDFNFKVYKSQHIRLVHGEDELVLDYL